MSAHIARVTALVSVLTICIAGCGSDEPKPGAATQPSAPAANPAEPATAPAPPSPPPRAAKPRDGVEGVQITDVGVLPDGFPEDIPTYPDATPAGSLALPGDMLSSFQTSDSVDDVYEFYRAGFQKQGWSIVEESDDRSHLRATKQGRTADIRLGKGREGTEIAVIVEGG
jgi:hypothetical protein